MASLFFPSDEIEIYRNRRVANTNRFTMSATYTSYEADIQPATKERIEMFNGRWGTVFTAFVGVSVDIKEGDQVIDARGKKYSVKGVQKWQGAGLLDYTELVLIAQDGS